MMEAVLFDFDGTIMDTEPAVIKSYEYVFERYASLDDFTPDKRLEVLGPPLRDEMVKFFPEEDPDECVRVYRNFQREHLIDLIKPMKGAKDLLIRLDQSGIKTGIISSRYKTSLDELLKQSKLIDFMSVVLGHDDVSKDKPDPEGIHKAMNLMGVNDCMYVGDSPNDILAGKNAGIKTCAFISNPLRKEIMESMNPDYLIDDFGALTQIVKQS